jgi:hypothetical protein
VLVFDNGPVVETAISLLIRTTNKAPPERGLPVKRILETVLRNDPEKDEGAKRLRSLKMALERDDGVVTVTTDQPIAHDVSNRLNDHDDRQCLGTLREIFGRTRKPRVKPTLDADAFLLQQGYPEQSWVFWFTFSSGATHNNTTSGITTSTSDNVASVSSSAVEMMPPLPREELPRSQDREQGEGDALDAWHADDGMQIMSQANRDEDTSVPGSDEELVGKHTTTTAVHALACLVAHPALPRASQ